MKYIVNNIEYTVIEIKFTKSYPYSYFNNIDKAIIKYTKKEHVVTSYSNARSPKLELGILLTSKKNTNNNFLILYNMRHLIAADYHKKEISTYSHKYSFNI